MIFISLFACLPLLCLTYPVQEWEEYKQKYGKVYTAEEDAVKYATWKHNMADIDLHNAQYGNTYVQGMNEFTDMSDDDFNNGPWTGLIVPAEDVLDATNKAAGEFVPSDDPNPEEVDWRKQGMVTGVKNQGHCGSCYSFAATGALEGAWMKKTGKLVSLSESQIVDCSRLWGNHGCHGGWYQWSWHYIMDAGGSECESDYPYQAKQNMCKFNKDKVCAKVTGFHNIMKGKEDMLTKAIAQVGPIAVAIDAGHRGFRSYKGGVYFDRSCTQRVNHAVLAVGYGSEDGMDYYLIKNSWGPGFGVDGYIKMARNQGNHCGIAFRAAYPTV